MISLYLSEAEDVYRLHLIQLFFHLVFQVVYIVEKNHNRACTGHIKPMQDGNTNVALFSPLDHRVPRIQVPMSECPDGTCRLMVPKTGLVLPLISLL